MNQLVDRSASNSDKGPNQGTGDSPKWQERFLRLLPKIVTYARFSLRNLPRHIREEAVQQVVVLALLNYVRLLERGIEDRAYAGPLARYAVAQYRAGRRAAERINSRDVLANACQLRHGRTLERLSCFDSSLGEWGEAIVEDRRYGPANAASMRVDFAAWLQSLPTRDRRVAETLATGETTSTVAQLFNVSAARIAQLRRELQRNWLVFQGETIPSTT
jgi:hypothetical protein